ncbi:MAG TPA: hypothetical protein VLG37_01155 [Candidatus Saccharimonadales bacterium]|nr:hypothetical protein [Candidatus Saccharimonadales bacterium]
MAAEAGIEKVFTDLETPQPLLGPLEIQPGHIVKLTRRDEVGGQIGRTMRGKVLLTPHSIVACESGLRVLPHYYIGEVAIRQDDGSYTDPKKQPQPDLIFLPKSKDFQLESIEGMEQSERILSLVMPRPSPTAIDLAVS